MIFEVVESADYIPRLLRVVLLLLLKDGSVVVVVVVYCGKDLPPLSGGIGQIHLHRPYTLSDYSRQVGDLLLLHST